MPHYDYECQNDDCGFAFEVQQSMSDKKRFKKCPVCLKWKLERVILQAPLGFVRREPTTVGQLAERNSKEMGKYGLEAARKRQDEAKVAAKAEAIKDLKKKLPKGARIPEQQEHKPWYGKLDKSQQKSISDDTTGNKAHKYIMTGE